jgi:hypothetical protein
MMMLLAQSSRGQILAVAPRRRASERFSFAGLSPAIRSLPRDGDSQVGFAEKPMSCQSYLIAFSQPRLSSATGAKGTRSALSRASENKSAGMRACLLMLTFHVTIPFSKHLIIEWWGHDMVLFVVQVDKLIDQQQMLITMLMASHPALANTQQGT